MNTKLSWMRMSLFAFVGVMTAMIMNGCAAPGAAGPGGKDAPETTHVVVVHFDANGCPTSVTPPVTEPCENGRPPPDKGFCAKRGHFIQWVAYEGSVHPFEIYFDPFVGRPYQSHGPNEKTQPIKIRVDAAAGEYKYGVLGLSCDDPTNKALDPPILVEN